MAPLTLPDVTLCAASSVNIEATLAAMMRCMDHASFGRVLLFTDCRISDAPPGLEVVPIARLASARAYSRFVLAELARHITTSHCLIVQWDSYILRPDAWDSDFLSFDYIGAPWPQFEDDHLVGNGGFSLRSKQLMDACLEGGPIDGHPEDVAICRTHRDRLVRQHGLRFADEATASRFAYERTPASGREFGFHGAFNLPALLSPDDLWSLYRTLDDSTSIYRDYGPFFSSLWRAPQGSLRCARLTFDLIRARLGIRR
jgi:hypothetical protein